VARHRLVWARQQEANDPSAPARRFRSGGQPGSDAHQPKEKPCFRTHALQARKAVIMKAWSSGRARTTRR